MSIQLQPVIKNEPPEEVLEEEISRDMKDIDIIYHPLCEDLIKSETVLEDILENKHLESVQTQVAVKAENSPFIKTENITQKNKFEDTSDGNVSRGNGQGVVEVQASNEHSNALSNLEIDEQSVIIFSKDSISVRNRKSKSSKKTDFVECYKTDDITLWEKEEEKIKVNKAPVIPVEAHEYTSLAKDKRVCNHCQQTYKNWKTLKIHIRTKHREVTTMYQCPYCPYKSIWKQYIINQHIIQKHKDTKDIQWFQCHLCEKKFKLKGKLTRHMKVHLRHKQMRDGLDLHEKRYGCNECDYETYTSVHLKSHKLTHLKPEEIQYLYCYHCSYKSKRKADLIIHIFRHHFKNVRRGKRYGCNKCDYETYTSTLLKNHKLIHLKPENIPYFHCYHCSYKSKQKGNLQRHIFKHLKNGEVKFDCYICNFMTQKRESIIEHIKKHTKVQINFEINEGN